MTRSAHGPMSPAVVPTFSSSGLDLFSADVVSALTITIPAATGSGITPNVTINWCDLLSGSMLFASKVATTGSALVGSPASVI